MQTPYYWVNETAKAGLKGPATIMAELSANLPQTLIDNAQKKDLSRLLLLGYALNVNIPLITSFTDDTCINLPFIQTRLTGSAVVDRAAYNETAGLFTYLDLVTDGTNQYINGDHSLPGETAILNVRFQPAVSVFTVNYDVPIECGTGCEKSVVAVGAVC